MISVMNTTLLDRPIITETDFDRAPQHSETSSESPGQRWRRPWRGRADDARWVRPALITLLVATAGLYLWGLGASGWANSFYSAAAQAGSQSWKAMFFGSSDAANFITVDKPPAALWMMALSVRMFGLNSWSLLVPEALMGVASVGVLCATIKRWFGAGAGLIAGAVLALTPVATLMFRFNNPDAMLVLVLVVAAYCVTRALEAASTKWISVAFALVGLGFLTKMMQALLVLPAFGIVYLLAAQSPLRRRLWQLVVATGAFLVAAGWWVAVVELVPASMRPYVGGSTNNSIINLILGYNGFGRLTGNETGSTSTTGRWGATGLLRLFNTEFGGQASWLIPAAVLLLVGGIVLCGRASRTDRNRSALVLWGTWLIVTALTFSLSKGIIHPYYTVALAPAIGALIGIGATMMWRRRSSRVVRIAMAAIVGATAAWAVMLLRRTPSWNAWLVPVVIVAASIAVVGLVGPEMLRRRGSAIIIGAVLIASLAGPTAYSVATAAAAQSGAIPSAGPSSGRAAGARGGFGAGTLPGGFAGGPAQGGTRPTAGATGAAPTGTPTGMPTGIPTGARLGGGGNVLASSTPSAALTTLLSTNSGNYTWVAATVGANSAAGYQLATGDPVMAIGGFNGSDPWPTLAAFQQYVANGRIHYFISGGGGGGGAGGQGGTGATSTNVSSQITAWVTAHYTATTIGGTIVYDLAP